MECFSETEEANKCDIVHQLLCMSCLRAGDTLHTLADRALQLYRLAANNGRQLIHNISPRVCWECEIQHMKVLHFRDRVTECHEVLSSSVTCDVTRPPRLQVHRDFVIDIPPLVTEYDKDEEIDIDVIKREILVDVDIKVEASETESRCPACLCAGRSLNSIGDKERIYYTEMLKQHGGAVTSPRLCWECGWMLRVAARFSEQSAESYRTLLPSLQTADIQDITALLSSGVSLPPRLRRCVCACVDIPSPQDVPAAAAALTQEPGRHLTHITTYKLHQCTHCSKKFITNYYLNIHLQTHTGGKPHQCDQCSKTFTSNVYLNIHLKIHHGEKPHQCSQCSMTFTTKYYLNIHLKTHTGKKPDQCSQCSKTFNTKSSFNKHLKTHTGEKPYQCNHCSKTFADKQNLKKHLMLHTGKKPHHCSHCSKRFITKHYLSLHLKKHTGEKFHQCSRCLKTFICKHNLNRHMKKSRQCTQFYPGLLEFRRAMASSSSTY